MKLAEALQERADLNREISQLESRLCCNATKQEGQEPPEDPQELMNRLNHCLTRLSDLTRDINLRNSTVVHDGCTVTELLAQRDTLSIRIRILRNLADRASEVTHRGTHSEIVTVSSVDVRALRRDLDNLSRDLRILDNTIQSINWATDL